MVLRRQIQRSPDLEVLWNRLRKPPNDRLELTEMLTHHGLETLAGTKALTLAAIREGRVRPVMDQPRWVAVIFRRGPSEHLPPLYNTAPSTGVGLMCPVRAPRF
jgi:hypothetical protein